MMYESGEITEKTAIENGHKIKRKKNVLVG